MRNETNLADEYTVGMLETALIIAYYTRDAILHAMDVGDTDTLRYGICNAWDEAENRLLTGPFDCVRNLLYREWPDYSDNSWYPIPMPESERWRYDIYEDDGGGDCEAEWMYDNTENMWEGEYGALRMECLEYVIRRLEEATA